MNVRLLATFSSLGGAMSGSAPDPRPLAVGHTEPMGSSLLEAWLEIRWRLDQLTPGAPPQFSRDPRFAFALGAFRDAVQDGYGYVEDIDRTYGPTMMVPHSILYRFRPGDGLWPLLQLGMGIAAVNFVRPYSWRRFQDEAQYLRSKLVEAFGEPLLEADTVTLRYRNGFPFAYSTCNLLHRLDESLGVSISLPPQVPGSASRPPGPARSAIKMISRFPAGGKYWYTLSLFRMCRRLGSIISEPGSDKQPRDPGQGV